MSLIYEGFDNPQLSEAIDGSPAKKLIQELNFKYQLKVIDKIEPNPLHRYSPMSFLMVDPSGFAVAKVWTDTEDGVDVYNYRSPFYRKDRGSDSADRETVHSRKLSTLMATLKRNNVIPPPNGMLNTYPADCFNQGINHMDSYHGNANKNNRFNAEDIHMMLKAILVGEIPSELNLDICKETLDKWDEQDKIKMNKREDIERFFSNEFYAVGADKLNHLVIGSVKKMPREGHNNYKFERVKPFKRVKEVPDELKAILTMNKVYCEGKGNEHFYANYIPLDNGYNPDLDIINSAIRRVDEFNLTWTLIPCSGI